MPTHSPHSQPDSNDGENADNPSTETSEKNRSSEHVHGTPGRSEGQFDLLVQAVKEYAIFMLDTEGHVQSWNEGAERIKGYSEEEIIGKHFSNFYTEEDRKAGRPETGLKSAEEEGQWTDEGWRVRKDGSRFWARVTITALSDEQGMLRGFAKVTRDLTDRKRREEKLTEEKREAERKNALLRLMQTVASAANDTESFEEALQVAVDVISEQTGWPVGHVFRRSGDETLEATGIWNRESEGCFDAFKKATETLSFKKGEGLPGRVLETGEPAWTDDVTEDPAFLQAKTGTKAGIKAAFAFPVSLENEPRAVLEFYSEKAEKPSVDLLQAMESVGMQLSRVAEREAARRKREKAKRRLEASEKRYRRLFEDAQEGIAITTPDGEIVNVNPAALKIFGIDQENLSALTTPDLYVDLEVRNDILETLQREGSISRKEVRFRRPDGEEIVCELSAVVQRREGDEPDTTLTFFRDVSDRKTAKEALKQSEKRYRRLFEESRDAIILTTPQGTIVDANEAAEELFGYPREELLSMNAADLYANPEERKRRIVPTLKEARSSRLLEAEMRHSEGHTFLASAAVTLHRNEEGRPELIQALVRDITEHRRLQREVLQVQEEERKRLGQELHDGLSSQLTGANMKLSVVSERVKRDFSSEEIVEGIQEVQTLIRESAGDVRRLSHGLNPAGLPEGDLPAALEGLAQSTGEARFEAPLHENHRADDCPQNGPGGIDHRFASILEEETATHLYRIAQEAVSNARVHGKGDEIVIRLSKEDGALVLEVEDDGVGFESGETDKNAGLGLRSMRHRAELIGADLTIESNPGEGTLVRCRLSV